jgi:UPF0755 protein
MKRTGFIAGLLCLALAGFLLLFVPAAWFSSPAVSAPTVQLSVSTTDSPSDVAAKLKDDGVVVSTVGYRLYSLIDSSARRPKPGAYSLQPGMNYHTIAHLLALGPAREEVQLQVIEGWDIRDIVNVLQEHTVTSTEFLTSVGDLKNNIAFDPTWRQEYPFLASLPPHATLEGYLFPDTYRVWKDQLPESLIKKQLDAFAERAPDLATQASAQGRSLFDVVTLASIIEKEVQAPEDRRIVAGIFMNRLKAGMALQSDATINYVTNSGRARSTSEDLAIDSLYNTYKYRGLPPGPICNPGADALDAALHPTKTEYQYFLTGKDGKVYYAKTLQEQDANKVKAFGG